MQNGVFRRKRDRTNGVKWQDSQLLPNDRFGRQTAFETSCHTLLFSDRARIARIRPDGEAQENSAELSIHFEANLVND